MKFHPNSQTPHDVQTKTTFYCSTYTEEYFKCRLEMKKEKNEWDFHFNGVGEAFSHFSAKKYHFGVEWKRKCFRKVFFLSVLLFSFFLFRRRYLLPVLINLRSYWRKKIDIMRPSKANNLFLSLHLARSEDVKVKKNWKLRKCLMARKFLCHFEQGKSINSITAYEHWFAI
jgi:hypothetical protein